jgi:hypothetical protein
MAMWPAGMPQRRQMEVKEARAGLGLTAARNRRRRLSPQRTAAPRLFANRSIRVKRPGARARRDGGRIPLQVPTTAVELVISCDGLPARGETAMDTQVMVREAPPDSAGVSLEQL